MAETTRAALTRPGPKLVEVGDLTVQGRAAAVRVWALDAEVSTPPPAHPRTEPNAVSNPAV